MNSAHRTWKFHYTGQDWNGSGRKKASLWDQGLPGTEKSRTYESVKAPVTWAGFRLRGGAQTCWIRGRVERSGFSLRDCFGSFNAAICGQGLLFYTVARVSSLGTHSHQNAHFAHFRTPNELWGCITVCKMYDELNSFGWGEGEKGMHLTESCLRVTAYALQLVVFSFQ